MEKIDKVTKIEIIVTDEGAKMYFNGNKETQPPIAYPELSKVGIILLEFCQQIQRILASKEKEND